MIKIQPELLLFTACLFLILPLDWILSAWIAAIIHELWHIGAVYILKGKIFRLKISSSGCILDTDAMGEWQQFLCILAGPFGSLILLLFCQIIPKIAICGFIHGLYNLLPVEPLDGGRMLRILLNRFSPMRSDWVMFCVAVAVCTAFTFLALWNQYLDSPSIFSIFLVILWNIKFVPRNIPCKPSKIGVQ